MRTLCGRPLPFILMFALALRVVTALLLPDQNFGDAAEYRTAGASLWTTGSLRHPLYMPLYPALIGLVGSGWPQMALDIALSVAIVALVYALTFAIFTDRTAAVLAALGTAIYPYFIFYAVAGLTETLFIALLLAAFVCWYRGRFARAAIFAVLSILAKPTLELLMPLLVLYFAFVIHRMPWRTATAQVVIYLSVYIALMSPWWLHNYREYGTFVRLNAGGGMMFYGGNNPHNLTGGALDTDADRDQFLVIADPLERDRAMIAAATAYIKENPKRFVELAGLKFVRFWRLWPYASDYASRIYVIVSLISFVPVLALAIAYALVWGWRERRVIAPILVLIGYLTAIHMALAASLRYRLPLEPFLICFAAVAVARIVRRILPTLGRHNAAQG